MSGLTALLVIDVQKGMFNKKIPAYKTQEVLGNINALIEKAHGAGAPVFIIQHAGEKVFAEGSEDWQLCPDLRFSPADAIVPKHKPNAFEGTTLGNSLEKMGVKRVVTCGYVTHGCVKATSLGAKDLGFEVTLAHDAHSSYSKDAADLIAKVGVLMTEAGVELKATKEIAF